MKATLLVTILLGAALPAQAWFGGNSGHRFRNILPLTGGRAANQSTPVEPVSVVPETPVDEALFTPPTTSSAMTAEEIICNAQIATCNLACAKSASPLANVCDAKTYKWACVCPRPVNSTEQAMMPEWEMPVPVHQCGVGRTKCIEACGANQKRNGTMADATAWHACVHGCSEIYQCGQKEQPPSPTRFDPFKAAVKTANRTQMAGKKLLAMPASLASGALPGTQTVLVPLVVAGAALLSLSS